MDTITTKFTGLPIGIAAIEELQSRPQWVAWRYEDRGGGKPTKPPISPRTGFRASHSKPQDWGSYHEAMQRAVKSNLAGVGYVMSEDDGLTGIDLDNCLTEEGDLLEWVKPIVDLAETYCEVSPSGLGLRLIAKGKVERSVKSDQAGIEVYRDKRYLTITGRQWPGSPSEIREAPQSMAMIMDRIAEFRTVADVPLPQTRVSLPGPASSSEMEELLSYIPATCGYHEWLAVLMAVHAETGGSDSGLAIADRWSAAGSNYAGTKEVTAKWKSFHSGGVTGRTIAQMARENGADLAEIAIKYSEPAYDPVEAQAAADVLKDFFDRREAERVKAERLRISDETVAEDDVPIGGALDYYDLPEDQIDAPGLVGEITNWICDTSPDPARIHALGAALVAVGTLMARKVYSLDRPAGTHLYIGAIAPSGLGKDHPQNCVKLILDGVTGYGSPMHKGWANSGPSLGMDLVERAACVMMADEFAEKFAGTRNRNAGVSTQAINEVFKELWGRNRGSYSMPTTVSRRGGSPIQCPALSFYGAATVSDFKESLISKDVTSGLYNRFLFLPLYTFPDVERDVEGDLEVPERIAARCKWLYNCVDEMQVAQAIRGDAKPEPVYIPFSDDAREMNRENRRYQKSMQRLSDDDAALALYGRYAEQIKRIAMIVACGRSPENLRDAVINASDMEFAKRIVRYSIEQTVLMVRRDMVEGWVQAQYKLILGIVRQARRISKANLCHKIDGRVKKRDRDDIIAGLIEGGNVVQEEGAPGKNGGRPPVFYVYRRG